VLAQPPHQHVEAVLAEERSPSNTIAIGEETGPCQRIHGLDAGGVADRRRVHDAQVDVDGEVTRQREDSRQHQLGVRLRKDQ
jgi:hypothetical protein